jgi:hypothetical protein
MNLRALIKNFAPMALLLALASGYAAYADESGPVAAAVPARGMTMTAVENTFGKPVEILPAVGFPPITRWIYPTCTVYFEHQFVIHSVIPRLPKS